jgi:hypothetical protein
MSFTTGATGTAETGAVGGGLSTDPTGIAPGSLVAQSQVDPTTEFLASTPTVTANQFGQLTFVTGANPGTDVPSARANDGMLWSAWQGFTVITDPPPSNAATPAPISVADGGFTEVTRPSASDVNFEGSTGLLQLDQSQQFTGAISGFTGQDQIDLTDIAGATANFTWQPNSSGRAGGTLSVTDGTHLTQLALLGQYAAGNFTLAADARGGTMVNDPPLSGPLPVSFDSGAAESDRSMQLPFSSDPLRGPAQR